MNTYKVNDFGSRSALETQVIFDLGKTTEKKECYYNWDTKEIVRVWTRTQQSNLGCYSSRDKL